MSSNVFSASLCLQSFCLSVGEEEGWWVVVCCPQYVVMEDLVIQKECPPGQTGTIIDLFGIRRLHSLECWSGCRWIHRVGLCSHCSWQHTQVCSFLFVVGRFLSFSAQCEPEKLQSVWKWQNMMRSLHLWKQQKWWEAEWVSKWTVKYSWPCWKVDCSPPQMLHITFQQHSKGTIKWSCLWPMLAYYYPYYWFKWLVLLFYLSSSTPWPT